MSENKKKFTFTEIVGDDEILQDQGRKAATMETRYSFVQ